MVPDLALVRLHRPGPDVVQILGGPDIEPLPHSHFAGGLIGAAVDLRHGLGQLLPDLLLCGAVNAALNLFPGARIAAHSKPRLPPSIRALPDRAAPLGGSGAFSGHCNFLLIRGIIGGQSVRQDFCPIAVPGTRNTGGGFTLLWENLLVLQVEYGQDAADIVVFLQAPQYVLQLFVFLHR